ncbi:VRR-NUC domain containing protein [uncultured Caudovirales phage]|uniref:VRR-NUC domain containing protein n=1 Tax=uncultured Caudovirales phage TaxID=2100421 RepID=A0A6J5NCY7_9CAUD|nr:VRR-NUC domain containing protein [uncultured Caudovirales phage]
MTARDNRARVLEIALPKRKAQPEAAIQRAIIARLRMSGIVCHHSPNAAKRSVNGGRRVKQDGMITGWPDLTVVGPEGLVAFLEVKAPGGKLSPAQAEIGMMLMRMGQVWAEVRSQDEAVATLQQWGWDVK